MGNSQIKELFKPQNAAIIHREKLYQSPNYEYSLGVPSVHLWEGLLIFRSWDSGNDTAASHCGILLAWEVLGMGFWVICITQFIGSTAWLHLLFD